MKTRTRNTTAAVLALIIGGMAVYAGSRVLMGIDAPSHPVLDWLVTYNVTMGGISVILAFFLWKGTTKAKPAAILILLLHFGVFLVLLTFTTGEEVALKSQIAMAVRSFIWGMIVWLHKKTPGN